MVPGFDTAVAGEKPADLLCLPNPEWLPQILTVTGPSADVAAFRAAAAGSGAIAWQRDYEQLEEDWVHALLAPPPAERGISVHGARVVAAQMRELIETYEVRASDYARRRCFPDGDDAVRYRFWSADWTPWRALATVRARWPGLTLHVKMLGIAE
jgi:hypothetical protein